MTKISIYNVDGNVAGNDRWIGTDAQNFNATKNFTPNGLADYFNHNQVIDSGNALRYTYQTLDPLEARRFGTISFITEIGPQVPFEEISKFLLSKYTLKYNIVSEYLQFLNGAKVVISKASDTNFFGLYKITNVNVYLPEPNFFNVDLSFIDGNGSMNEDQDYIISLVLDKYDQIPTKTSDLTNDGADGVHPFITAQDIPPSASTLQDVVNNGNGISNYGGIGHADIQSTNFTNNRTLYINNNAFPTIKIVDNANASHNLTIDLDTLNLNGTSYNWSSIVDGVPKNLQQVTDIGNTTTNSIISQDSNYYSIIEPSDIGTENISTGAYTYLGANGVIGIKTGNFEGDIKTTNLTNGLTLEFPNKPAGVYTIATTSDIPSTPTLQQVLDNNHALLNGNNLQGTGAGVSQSGTNVISFGNYSSNHSTGSDINAFGNLALGGNLGAYNSGSNVNAFGSSAGYSNTYNYVNLFGKNSSADEDGQTVLSKNGTILARLSTSLLTDTRKYSFPNTSGTIALTSDIPSLTGYVPYTGATTDVDLGEKELTTGKLYLYDAVNGPTEKGSLHYADEALHFENSDGETLMYIEPGFMQLHKTGTIQSNFFTTLLTTNRDHYLPDASGTIALTSDITGTNSGVNTGDETATTIKSKLGITTLSGSNTGDQDLSGLVIKNTAITGATKTKITYDAKGLVTNGADATTADIADSTNKRYVTDANLTTIGNQSGTNTGDETATTIKSKLGISTLSGSNTGDETNATIKSKLGAATTSVDGYLTSTDWNTFNNKPSDLVTTNRQTASYTLVLADRNKLVEMNVATANNLTIPLNSSVAFQIGTKIDIVQYGAGQTTFVATSGVTIRSANNWLKMNAKYGAATLTKIGTDEWYLWGNLNA